ncbi:ABC transporter substrate-binding protein [Propionibacteriaceae bacterium G57]|uniref:ABC transporter substrate-binding protein n=1 Tax=Aestuariimicrobium sp. G57 TaxID=3418485 RepID=UPI003DA77C64
MRRRTFFTVSAALAGAGLIAGCAPDVPGQNKQDTNLTLLRIAPSSAMAAHWAQFAVAQEQGYFADAGIRIELQFPGGSADVMQALATNRVDIGGPTPEAALSALANGQKARMFYNWSREAVQSLAVLEASPVQSFADMRGKKIGVQTISSGAKLLAEAALRDADIDPANVTFVAVGVGVAAMDALNRAAVDALMLWDTEYVLMEESGTKLRTILPDSYKQLFSTGFVATDESIASKKDALAGFGKAWAEATVWATANPEEAIKTMWKLYPQTKTSDDPALLTKQVAIFKARNEKAIAGDPAGTRSFGKFTPESAKAWTEFAAEYGITKTKVNPDDFYTNEFVEKFNDFNVDEITAKAKSAKS